MGNLLKIEGSGVSGLASEFVVPEWHIGLDCGLGLPHARRTRITFITHGHLDHIGGVARHAYIRKMTQQPPSVFVIPRDLKEPLTEHIAWWSKTQRSRPALCQFHVLEPGNKFFLNSFYETSNTCERYALAQETFHTIPSQGYVFFERRRKLLENLKNKTPLELKTLRESGADMYEWLDIPLLGYTGDTTIEALTQPNNAFIQARKLVVECTYLDATVSLESAKQRGHIHLNQLLEILPTLQCEEVTLTHFSQRHTEKHISDAIEILKKNAPHIDFTSTSSSENSRH